MKYMSIQESARMKLLPLASFAFASLALTGCQENLVEGAVLHVASGYIELGATPDRPAAGYFTVEGGEKPVNLVAVSADLAQRVDMHESVKENGMMTMKPLRSVPVPAKGEMTFAPGGKHLMIWNINPVAIEAGRLPMVFVFTNKDRILFDLTIRKPAAPAGATDTTTGDAAKADAAAMDHMAH
jgi:periplasmic copper chaperone A